MRKSGMKALAVLSLAAVLMLAGCGGKSGGTAQSGGDAAASSAAAASAEAAGMAASSVEIPEGGSVSRDTDITAAVHVDFTTMDPMDTSDTLSGGIQRLVLDGLYGFDDDMKAIPMLASSYEANDTATEFTIHLREGISFSDGTPFNADAVLANVARWADKSLGLKRTTFLSNVLDHAEKVDDYTVKIYLSEPFGPFINCLAHPATLIVSPKQIEAGQEALAQKPVGTGQYVFDEWVPGDHLKLSLNTKWWGFDEKLAGGTALAAGDAGFKSVTFKPVKESASRVAMLQSGDAQIIWPVPEESVSVLKADPNVTMMEEEGLAVWYLTMNTQKKPFTDVKVRQAVNYAINKEAFLQIVKNGLGKVATAYMGPKTQFSKENTPYPYDPAKAKELLKEAGYPDGFTAKIIYTNTSANQKVMEFLKQQLAEVGITLELEGQESAIVNQRIQGANVPGAEAEVEFYYSGWSSSTGEADWALRPLFMKESEPPLSYNISYYENEEVDKLFKEGLATADASKRQEIYAKLQDILWEDVPAVPVLTGFNTIAVNNKIANVKVYPDNAVNMRNARMAK